MKKIKWALLLTIALTCNLLPSQTMHWPVLEEKIALAAEDSAPQPTFTPDEVLDELFPGLPPFSTDYPTSYDELGESSKTNIYTSRNYKLNGETHTIDSLSGENVFEYGPDHIKIDARAEFKMENVDTDWAARLSSNKTVYVRWFNGKLYPGYNDEDSLLDKYSGSNRSYLCLYGDKTEKWFKNMGGELRPRGDMPGAIKTDSYYAYQAEGQTGFLEYDPIVTVSKEYTDRYITDDIGVLFMFIHYADEDLLYPETLELTLDDWSYTIALDDIKHNMAFKSSLVSFGTGNQRDIYEPKINAIYNEENDYDPFLDPDSTPKPLKPTQEPTKPTQEPTANPSEEPAKPTQEPSAPPTIEPSTQPMQAPENADEITILVGGEKIDVEQKLIMVNDRVLVPMRAIFEALGAQVAWENETRTVTAESGEDVIVLRIGEEWFTKNGTVVQVDVPSIIYHDRTYIPIRAIAESLERTVTWDPATKTVTVE